MSYPQEITLREYIKDTILIEYDKELKIRCSKELYDNYKRKFYNQELNNIYEAIKKIQELQIKYPGNANPVFYIYIVPDDNFQRLLNFPSDRLVKGGGKPVVAYDLDSFPLAYGISSNILLNRNNNSMMQKENTLHELSHLVSSMFFTKDRYWGEGFAENLPLYTLNYEEKFTLFKNTLNNLNRSQILTAKELIEIGISQKFDTKTIINNTSCSFKLTYISSYLLVRVILEAISHNYACNRIVATQKFLEMMRNLRSIHEFLLFEIAEIINLDKEKLYKTNEYQLRMLNKTPF